MSLMRRKCCCDCYDGGRGCTTGYGGADCDSHISDCPNTDGGLIAKADFPSSIKVTFDRKWVGAWGLMRSVKFRRDTWSNTVTCGGFEIGADCETPCLRCADHACWDEPSSAWTVWKGYENGSQSYECTLYRGNCTGAPSATDCCSVSYSGTYTLDPPDSWPELSDLPGGADEYASRTRTPSPTITMNATVSVGFIPYGRSQYQVIVRISITGIGTWAILGGVKDSCGTCCFPVQTNATAQPYDFENNQATIGPAAEDNYPESNDTFDIDGLDCPHNVPVNPGDPDCFLCTCRYRWFSFSNGLPVMEYTDCGQKTSLEMHRYTSSDFSEDDYIWPDPMPRDNGPCGNTGYDEAAGDLGEGSFELRGTGIHALWDDGTCTTTGKLAVPYCTGENDSGDWIYSWNKDNDFSEPSCTGIIKFSSNYGREHNISVAVNF